jgi:hypothetical protein
MPNTLIPIQTYTLSATTASVTFSNIPQNYTDLKVVVSAITTGGTQNCSIAFNGSTSNFSNRQIGGDGSTTYSVARSDNLNALLANGTNYTADVAASSEIYIPNYSGGANKAFNSESATENNDTGADLVLRAHLWSQTAAINSITIFAANGSGSFAAKSTFTLYGISNGVKATGGTLTVAGGYAYHTFTSTGSFLPSQQIKGAEVLLVAGGGAGASVGGSAETGGGGGAGGFRGVLLSTLSAGNSFTALVGAGGSSGASGSNSVFAGVSATGGGAGGGGTGGSGGGGLSANSSGRLGGAGNAGNYNPVEGFAGGNGNSSSSSFAGGGGGAGAAGANGTSGQSGAGGIGSNTYSTWATITGTGVSGYYAGGGGGGSASGISVGAGGAGGGGAGLVAGTANTGGGGGGGGVGDGSSRSGGSGLIIVRYRLD